MRISAVILAAGMSTRMGKPKILLPWGEGTIIEQIVDVLLSAKVDEIIVVVGSLADDVSALLKNANIKVVKNEHYTDGSMMTSLKVGLINMSGETTGALVVLGDNPQIKEEIIYAIVESRDISSDTIVIPSYQHKRGHPWFLPQKLFSTVLGSDTMTTMRMLLNIYQDKIRYVEVDSPSILLDIDTPEDYLKYGSV